jgi:hypothetical protein
MAFSGERAYVIESSKALRDLAERLRAEGWKPLASKANPCFVALLYVSPDGTQVCKAARDMEWGRFIRWAAENPHPNLPRVFSVEDLGEGITVAYMEKLDPLPWKGDAWNYEPRARERKAVKEQILRASAFTRGYDWTTKKLRSVYATEADQALFDKLREQDFTDDLHGYNIMLRDDKKAPCFVIIDPAA